MVKNNFKTVVINDLAYDLPKNMPIPRKGEIICADGYYGVVTSISYQFDNNSADYMITIRTRGLTYTDVK